MAWFDWLKIRPKGQKFEERPELDKLITGKAPEIPIEVEPYFVTVQIEDFSGNVAARTYSKKGKLYLSMDLDMETVLDKSKKEQKDKQRLQTWLHELMHVALFKRNDITHSTDKKSILYYSVDGSNLAPTVWDLDVMRDAANKIPQIRLKVLFQNYQYPNAYFALISAVGTWNAWIGKKLFVIE